MGSHAGEAPGAIMSVASLPRVFRRRASRMHLFANELSTSDAIRDEVDLGIELPVVCDLANEFLQPIPLSAADADEVDEMLAILLRHTSPSLKLEVAERLAHVSQGIRIERGSWRRWRGT